MTDGTMRERVAIVTGGTGGLGCAVVRLLLEAGARVAVPHRDPGKLALLAASVPAHAATRLRAVAADVTDAAAVAALVGEVTAGWGRLDVLVNGVGGFAPGDLLTTDERLWDHMLGLNLRSAYLCCRAVLPAMIAGGGGRIVNVASRAILAPVGGLIGYTVSKAGVVALTRALAEEVRHHGVTVNCVLPGTIDTEANRRAMPDADFSRWVAPDTVARAIQLLVSAGAAPISGTLVAV